MTFESLTSTYRMERGSSTLSNVRKDLYRAMMMLLEDQTKEYDRLASTNPDSIMFDGASERKKKISQTMKMIVEIRMTKISALALRGAMGAVNMVDALTPEEKEYYTGILGLSKKHWTCVDKKKKSIRIPDVTAPVPTVALAPATVDAQTLGDMPDVEDYSAPITEEVDLEDAFSPDDPIPAEIASEKDTATSDDVAEREPVSESEPVPKPSPDTVIVRILENLPPFSGPDRDYDLKKEDILRMPTMMAMALVNRDKAVLIDTTP